jgi:hypothetical protein
MFLNFTIFVFKCWILLKPVQGDVDGNLHFSIPSMNRLNQTEPATFSILSCWAFFRDSVFLYFVNHNILIMCSSYFLNIISLARGHDLKLFHQQTALACLHVWKTFQHNLFRFLSRYTMLENIYNCYSLFVNIK